MTVSKVPSRSEPELCGISISMSRAELSEAMGSIWPGAHKRVKGNGSGGNAGGVVAVRFRTLVQT